MHYSFVQNSRNGNTGKKGKSRLSVCILVNEPDDMDYYLPVASERCFNQFWQAGIDDLELRLIGNGRVIDRDHFAAVFEELEKLKEWTCKNPELNKKGLEGERSYILERMQLLLKELPDLFKDLKVRSIWMG